MEADNRDYPANNRGRGDNACIIRIAVNSSLFQLKKNQIAVYDSVLSMIRLYVLCRISRHQLFKFLL